MAPFLWMGFNCLKARATSRRQFTFYSLLFPFISLLNFITHFLKAIADSKDLILVTFSCNRKGYFHFCELRVTPNWHLRVVETSRIKGFSCTQSDVTTKFHSFFISYFFKTKMSIIA